MLSKENPCIYVLKLLPLVCVLLLEVEGEEFNIKEFEQKLSSYFECLNRSATSKIAKIKNTNPPSFSDLQKIAQNWNYLSNGFKKIYIDAISIPNDYLAYKSKGFGIEVYFTTNGINAVDTTDTWGIDSLNWHKRNPAKNGIPDYVEEVAWSLDSAWNLEVNRFGFPKPYPYNSSSNASYIVQIVSENAGNYGLTYPTGPIQGSSGFMSLVTIRNNWHGWDYNEIINYESHPESGIRVTCAHELFHAIQYRMSKNVKEDIFLDDFPVSWLEATSGMMEELAFGDVNDFTQYAKSYFDNPTLFTAFGKSTGTEIYANSLITLFTYKRLGDSTGINFFRSIFLRNMSGPFNFNDLIKYASELSGLSWTENLGLFYSLSFFTADRVYKNRFLDDASLLPAWKYLIGEGNKDSIISKVVLPWSVQFVSYLNEGNEGNILKFTGRVSGVDNKNFSLHVITRANSGTYDSIIKIDISGIDTITGEIINWNTMSEAILVLTNGDRDNNLSFKIGFRKSPLMVKKSIIDMYDKHIESDHRTFLLSGRQINKNFPMKSLDHKSGSVYLITQRENENVNRKIRIK